VGSKVCIQLGLIVGSADGTTEGTLDDVGGAVVGIRLAEAEYRAGDGGSVVGLAEGGCDDDDGAWLGGVWVGLQVGIAVVGNDISMTPGLSNDFILPVVGCVDPVLGDDWGWETDVEGFENTQDVLTCCGFDTGRIEDIIGALGGAGVVAADDIVLVSTVLTEEDAVVSSNNGGSSPAV